MLCRFVSGNECLVGESAYHRQRMGELTSLVLAFHQSSVKNGPFTLHQSKFWLQKVNSRFTSKNRSFD